MIYPDGARSGTTGTYLMRVTAPRYATKRSLLGDDSAPALLTAHLRADTT